MHSTITGETCAGSIDSVSLSANVKLALQEAADDTVFNQTAGMSYYPWEVSEQQRLARVHRSLRVGTSNGKKMKSPTSPLEVRNR